MWLPEEEAKKRLCPFRTSFHPTCQGSSCMLWTWVEVRECRFGEEEDDIEDYLLRGWRELYHTDTHTYLYEPRGTCKMNGGY